MAQIHKGKSALRQSARQNLIYSILCFVPLVFYLMAFALVPLRFDSLWHLVFIVLCGWPSAYLYHQYTIKKRGIEGEENTFKALAKLPDNYHIFNNVQIEHQGYSHELDIIVLGPNGVFVVEVKNLNGSISGNILDSRWIQHKIGRKGGEYSQDIRNPVKQVKGQVHSLAKSLQATGIDVWVDGIVFFSHPKVTLRVRNQGYPIITSANALNNLIKRNNPRKRLGSQVIKQATGYILSKQVG